MQNCHKEDTMVLNGNSVKRQYEAPALTVVSFKPEQGYIMSNVGVSSFQMDMFEDFTTAPKGNEASHFGESAFDWN